MGKISIIVANGKVHDRETIQARLKSLGDYQVIAVNGGSKNCQLLGLGYDIVLGDLDSLGNAERKSLLKSGLKVEHFPTGKDETDLELALLHAVNQDAQQMILLGTIGGRLDMTLSNIFLLTHPKLQGVSTRIWHGDQTAWLVQPPGEEIEGQEGDTISLIPIGSTAQGITTENLEYVLNGDDLDLGSTRGISNVMKGSNARISLQHGTLLAIHTPGRA